MKVLSTIALSILALSAFSTSASADVRPIQVVQRYEAAIHAEARVALDELDAIGRAAERRLLALAEQDARPVELRLVYHDAVRDLGLACGRGSRTIEAICDEGIRILARLGVERSWMTRLERMADGRMAALVRRETEVTKRLERMLERLL